MQRAARPSRAVASWPGAFGKCGPLPAAVGFAVHPASPLPARLFTVSQGRSLRSRGPVHMVWRQMAWRASQSACWTIVVPIRSGYFGSFIPGLMPCNLRSRESSAVARAVVVLKP